MKEGYEYLAPDPENWKKLHYHVDSPESEQTSRADEIFNNGFIIENGKRWSLVQTKLLNVDEHTNQTGEDQRNVGRAIEYILKRD